MSLQSLTDGEKLPILFVGSGLTRRYKNAPDWTQLLHQIAEYIDVVADFKKLQSQVSQNPENKSKQDWEIYALIASHLELEFNKKFYSKHLEPFEEEWIADGKNPFRECIAYLIEKNDYVEDEKLQSELKLLKQLDGKIIASITTNYDCMLEEIFSYSDDSTFVGQPELFSPKSSGLSEVYKLHGCISKPEKIIISYEDYNRFEQTAKLFTAKLMTLMSENPVIFIGYSINDPNVHNVLKDLVSCLDRSQVDELNKHFYVVEYAEGQDEVLEKTHTFNATSYDGHSVAFPVTVLSTDNYGLIYEELYKLKPTLNLKLVRQIKRLINEIVLDTVESDHVNQNKTPQIAVMLDDLDKIDSPDGIAVMLGPAHQISQYGYGIHDIKFIIEDIIFEKNTFKSKLLVQVTFDKHICAKTRLVPIHKYISDMPVQEVRKFSRVVKYARHRNTADTFLNSDYKSRMKTADFPTIDTLREIVGNYKFETKAYKTYVIMIKTALENKNMEYVKEFLQKEFYNYDKMNTTHVSDFKRLACIYDFVMYQKHTFN